MDGLCGGLAASLARFGGLGLGRLGRFRDSGRRLAPADTVLRIPNRAGSRSHTRTKYRHRPFRKLSSRRFHLGWTAFSHAG